MNRPRSAHRSERHARPIPQLAGAFVGVLALLGSAPAWAATYYISPTGDDGAAGTDAAPWATFNRAYQSMSAGDTLIAKNGTYVGQNVLSRWDGERPPSGTGDTGYTTVQAETDGGVVVDGQGLVSPIAMDGPSASPVQFIVIRGIVFRHQANGASLYQVDHVKFLRDGFEDSCDGNCATVGVTGRDPDNLDLLLATDLLFEECYAWGSGRYKFLTYHVARTVFRRTVVRFDRTNTAHDGTTEPIGGYSFYHSDQIECQNCVSIDGDQSQFWVNVGEYCGSFCIPSTDGPSTNIHVVGSIALNVDMAFAELTKQLDHINFQESVGWHLREGVWARDAALLAHTTFGDLYGPGVQVPNVGLQFSPGDDPVNATSLQDSVVTGVQGTALSSFASEDYNVLSGNTADYADTPAGSHTVTTAPSFRHLPRVEADDAARHGTASDGGDRGANVLYRIGESGTLWGEAGYDTVTSESLWPFPYEDVIRRDMQSYSYTGPTATEPFGADSGPNETLDGARGFCADGAALSGAPITLTSYIWEFLGEPCPTSICEAGTGGGGGAGVGGTGGAGGAGLAGNAGSTPSDAADEDSSGCGCRMARDAARTPGLPLLAAAALVRARSSRKRSGLAGSAAS